jgi:hypothetical protein
MKACVTLLFVCACLPPPTPVAPPAPTDPAVLQQQRRDAFARSNGYPTRHTKAELEEMIAGRTKDYVQTGTRRVGHLDAPEPIRIEAARDTCYRVVYRLVDGAAWGPGAEAGLSFNFRGPNGNGTGGPGVHGPGAVVTAGCPDTNGVITLSMEPQVGHDPIGHGDYTFEIWAHHLSKQQAADRKADIQRQIDEQREQQREDRRRECERSLVPC